MTTRAGTSVPTPESNRVPTPETVHRPAPWVRTRLRAGPLAAVLMAALAFVTVFAPSCVHLPVEVSFAHVLIVCFPAPMPLIVAE